MIEHFLESLTNIKQLIDLNVVEAPNNHTHNRVCLHTDTLVHIEHASILSLMGMIMLESMIDHGS